MPHEYRRKRVLPQGHRDQRKGVTAMVANWIHVLYDIPGLYSIAYPLWMAHGIVLGLLLGFIRDLRLMELAAIPVSFVLGALSIILSRPLAEGRNAMPIFVRYLDEGWWGFVDYGPSWFQFTGSASVGFSFGMLAWVFVPNLTVAAIIGLVSAVAVWVWTWYLFPELDE